MFASAVSIDLTSLEPDFTLYFLAFVFHNIYAVCILNPHPCTLQNFYGGPTTKNGFPTYKPTFVGQE